MSSKKLVVRLCIGACATAFVFPVARAAEFLVNDEAPLNIVVPGVNYVAGIPADTSTLGVTTDGFAFCANVGSQTSGAIITLAPSPPRWTLPDAYLKKFNFTGAKLLVNRPASGPSIEHTLSCQVRLADGLIASPFSRWAPYIFVDGFDRGIEATQYASMVNWQPVAGFDWASPDWSEVPVDSCSFTMAPDDLPAVEELSLCAAAAGIVPNGTDSFGQRSRTMWTHRSGSSVGSTYAYLARIDLRLGQQSGLGPNSGFDVLTPDSVQQVPESVDFEIRDGYDSDYLSDSYTYCFRTSLPAAPLNASACSGQPSWSGTGVVEARVPLSIVTGTTEWSRYLVVVRTTESTLIPGATPVAAVAVLSDPMVIRDDVTPGDMFSGDNVIFGFAFEDGVFPWMTP